MKDAIRQFFNVSNRNERVFVCVESNAGLQ